MEWWQSLILGLVEGLTEYLPVSSTGHLLVTQRLLGIGNSEAADAYVICIQIGAILAVLGLYYRRILQMAQGALGKDPVGWRLGWNIIAAFVPAAVIGLLFEKTIKAHLFGVEPVIAAWFVGGIGILILVWSRHGKPPQTGLTLEQLTLSMAVIIGFGQCVAMWPGVSRSLVTIVVGTLVGLSLPAAVEFSFLLGVVTLSAATAYDFLKHGHAMIEQFGIGTLSIGLVAAFVSALIAVKWMVGYLNRHNLSIFGYYRILIALVCGVLLLLGKI